MNGLAIQNRKSKIENRYNPNPTPSKKTYQGDRNPEAAVHYMATHVTLRQEELVGVIKEAIARLYMT